jgi:hypothetical protein
MKKKHGISGLTAAAIALALPTIVAAQSAPDKQEQKRDPATWRFNTGLSYSQGDYGDTRDTKVTAVPIGIKYSRGGLSLRVSVPYVYISGPGSLIQTPEGRDAGSGGNDSGSSSNSGSGSNSSGSGSSGSGSSGSGSSGSGSSGSGSSGSGSSGSGSSGSGSAGSGSGTSTTGGGVQGTGILSPRNRNGIGDVTVGLTYSFDFGSDFFADVTGKVKIPTASTRKRLGTGKVDITAGLDLVKNVGNASLYVGGRRRFNGSTTTRPLRDTWGFGGGLSLRASRVVSLGLDYDWQQSSFRGSGPSSEITASSSFRLDRKTRFQIYGSTGFTTNSADLAGGATISRRF